MTLSNYPPGVSGNEPQITGVANYPGLLPSNDEVDAVEIPDNMIRRLADRVSDAIDDDVEELAMDLTGNMPSFDTDMIDYDDFMDGPYNRLVDRILTSVLDHLTPADVPRGYTPRTDDVHEWVKSSYRDHRNLVVQHTTECDLVSAGDECIGGCKVMTS